MLSPVYQRGVVAEFGHAVLGVGTRPLRSSGKLDAGGRPEAEVERQRPA
ncbi:MAG: hypothetical protein R2710_22245 [Acidimicrobiales bacterium]